MSKSKVIKFNEFMSGEYKMKEKTKKQKRINTATKLASAAILPLATGGAIGTLGFAMKAFAATNAVPAMAAVAPGTSTAAPIVMEVAAKQWMSEQALSTLAHVLDPIVDVLVALSFPIASVIIVGGCFFFMFGKSEKAWTTIQNAGLGYILIQVSPLILDVLKKVGDAAV